MIQTRLQDSELQELPLGATVYDLYYYSGLQQLMDIYDSLIKAIPSLYDVTKDDEGIKNFEESLQNDKEGDIQRVSGLQ